MKIAVATDGSTVSPHFGHCSEFTIVTVENGKAVDSAILPNPEHQPDFLPQYLSEHGVSCIIAGRMKRLNSELSPRSLRTCRG
jgi:predicted Fe-Mo cluster-binding NifX family protein